jgi:putative intracellular protease/amidase
LRHRRDAATRIDTVNADVPTSDPDSLWRRPEEEFLDDIPLPLGPRPAATIEHDRADDSRADGPFTIAIVSFQGVKFDEWSAFRSVLAHWPGSHTVNVGFHVGRVGGAGGFVDVQAEFEAVPTADIVVVPGGLGVEQASHDPRLRRWLRQTVPSARWVLASSTGSVVLAAAGLLDGQPAATFWLAADLLARHGSEKVPDRIHVSESRVVTCAGSASAFECACLVIERELGADEVARIRAELIPPADDRRGTGSRRRLRRPARPADDVH